MPNPNPNPKPNLNLIPLFLFSRLSKENHDLKKENFTLRVALGEALHAAGRPAEARLARGGAPVIPLAETAFRRALKDVEVVFQPHRDLSPFYSCPKHSSHHISVVVLV